MSLVINTICGGGAGVRFVIGNTEPASGLDKTIWVQTTVSIPAYVFSYDQPSGTPANGTVWVKTGNSSPVAFNALNGNDVLMVYPTQCKQYVSGAWVAKTAKSYLNNAWQDWAVWLFQAGTGQVETWTAYNANSASSDVSSTSKITLSSSSSVYTERAAYTGNLDLSNYSTLYFDIECPSGTLSNVVCGITTKSSEWWNEPDGTKASPSQSGRYTLAVDISAASRSSVKVFIWAKGSGTEYVYNVYLA